MNRGVLADWMLLQLFEGLTLPKAMKDIAIPSQPRGVSLSNGSPHKSKNSNASLISFRCAMVFALKFFVAFAFVSIGWVIGACLGQ